MVQLKPPEGAVTHERVGGPLCQTVRNEGAPGQRALYAQRHALQKAYKDLER
jgi:hypothetical protein